MASRRLARAAWRAARRALALPACVRAVAATEPVNWARRILIEANQPAGAAAAAVAGAAGAAAWGVVVVVDG